MDDTMVRLTAKLVAAYARNNAVAADDLTRLIRETYAALATTASPQPEPAERPQPVVPIRRSVSADAILCLECGKPQKTLKRHLQAAHGLSVAEYRAKWSLPADYPMVAPAYAQRRSELAMEIGLGRKKAPADAGADTEADAGGEAEGSEDKPLHRYPASRWSKPVG